MPENSENDVQPPKPIDPSSSLGQWITEAGADLDLIDQDNIINNINRFSKKANRRAIGIISLFVGVDPIKLLRRETKIFVRLQKPFLTDLQLKVIANFFELLPDRETEDEFREVVYPKKEGNFQLYEDLKSLSSAKCRQIMNNLATLNPELLAFLLKSEIFELQDLTQIDFIQLLNNVLEHQKYIDDQTLLLARLVFDRAYSRTVLEGDFLLCDFTNLKRLIEKMLDYLRAINDMSSQDAQLDVLHDLVVSFDLKNCPISSKDGSIDFKPLEDFLLVKIVEMAAFFNPRIILDPLVATPIFWEQAHYLLGIKRERIIFDSDFIFLKTIIEKNDPKDLLIAKLNLKATIDYLLSNTVSSLHSGCLAEMNIEEIQKSHESWDICRNNDRLSELINSDALSIIEDYKLISDYSELKSLFYCYEKFENMHLDFKRSHVIELKKIFAQEFLYETRVLRMDFLILKAGLERDGFKRLASHLENQLKKLESVSDRAIFIGFVSENLDIIKVLGLGRFIGKVWNKKELLVYLRAYAKSIHNIEANKSGEESEGQIQTNFAATTDAVAIAKNQNLKNRHLTQNKLGFIEMCVRFNVNPDSAFKRVHALAFLCGCHYAFEVQALSPSNSVWQSWINDAMNMTLENLDKFVNFVEGDLYWADRKFIGALLDALELGNLQLKEDLEIWDKPKLYMPALFCIAEYYAIRRGDCMEPLNLLRHLTQPLRAYIDPFFVTKDTYIIERQDVELVKGAPIDAKQSPAALQAWVEENFSVISRFARRAGFSKVSQIVSNFTEELFNLRDFSFDHHTEVLGNQSLRDRAGS